MYKAGFTLQVLCVITATITLLINNQQNASFVHHVSLPLQVLCVITAPITLLINNQQNASFIHQSKGNMMYKAGVLLIVY
jgi:iron only hydrogenase large subunit-like protein